MTAPVSLHPEFIAVAWFMVGEDGESFWDDLWDHEDPQAMVEVGWEWGGGALRIGEDIWNTAERFFTP